MLDHRTIAEDPEGTRRRLARRPSFDPAQLERVLQVLSERSRCLTETQALQAERNQQNKAMKAVFQKGTDAEKAEARAAQKASSERVKALEERASELEAELHGLLLAIPNLPADDIPDGADESGNRVVRTVGEPPQFEFEPKDHVALAAEGWKQLDFERAAKLAGSRFSVLFDDMARLERALAHFMLDVHVREHGYREVSVPFLVNTDALTGTGQLPKFEADQFKVPFTEHTDYWLIPTAEVPLTNLYADTILEPADGALPHGFCAHTPCFRKEAGAAGRDTRGILRQHQFHKVELVRFAEPENGPAELEHLVGHAEAILQKLELHYRVSLLCAGDMSANAAKCYDLEVWLPGQSAYREISSCSWFGDYQARRAKIRYRSEAKAKPRLVHTLNGSGLAVGRTAIALLEQHQRRDGTVRIPEALQPYVGADQLPGPGVGGSGPARS